MLGQLSNRNVCSFHLVVQASRNVYFHLNANGTWQYHLAHILQGRFMRIICVEKVKMLPVRCNLKLDALRKVHRFFFQNEYLNPKLVAMLKYPDDAVGVAQSIYSSITRVYDRELNGVVYLKPLSFMIIEYCLKQQTVLAVLVEAMIMDRLLHDAYNLSWYRRYEFYQFLQISRDPLISSTRANLTELAVRIHGDDSLWRLFVNLHSCGCASCNHVRLHIDCFRGQQLVPFALSDPPQVRQRLDAVIVNRSL